MACISSTSLAWADPDACVDAYVGAQKMRSASKLLDARKQMVFCAQDTCPAVLRKDCAQWLAELDQTIPQLAVTIRGADGCDRPDAELWIDGVFAAGPPGVATNVDPGPHEVRVRVGDATAQQDVVMLAGERPRTISISLGPTGATCGAPRSPPPAKTSAPTTAEGAATPPIVYVLGAIGLAGVLVSTDFSISAWGEKGTLDQCKGSCLSHDVDTMRRTFLAADLSGGVALAFLAAATAFYLLRK
jgi:hypothetical protein